MKGGYQGKILRVDLSERKIIKEELNWKASRNFIGGSGLAAHYLYNGTGPETDPLGENNQLIFMTGPFTGTPALGSNRFAVVAKSPLTGIWGESDCGGHWGEMLKKCGFDGIIIQGKSTTPVFLKLENNTAEIIEANDLWGLDIFQTDKILKERLEKKVEIACIGPAGENQVKIAGIFTEGVHARVAARCGLVAVMGSKNLKAITVCGNQKTPIANKKDLISMIRKITPDVKKKLDVLTQFGTSINIECLEPLGDIPIKNYSKGSWKEGVANLCTEKLNEKFLTGNYYCGRCVVGCGRVVKLSTNDQNITELGGPEYESLAMLGMNCMVSDLKGVLQATELCNRMGIDVISTGNIIAFAMEAFEKGMITEADTDGLTLSWGNVDVVLTLINQIAQKKGFGALLGQGVRVMAKHIGEGAEAFSQHSKGLEMPAHDPRAKFATALAYATSNRGACHLQAFTTEFEGAEPFPELGYNETLDRFQTKGKGIFTAKLQNVMAIYDSLKQCKFMLLGGVNLKEITIWLEAITGEQMSITRLLITGERIFNLKRLYNNRMGVTKKNDQVNSRVLKLSFKEGGAANKLPFLDSMLIEYYNYRKWDDSGVPNLKKIKEIGLESYFKKFNEERR